MNGKENDENKLKEKEKRKSNKELNNK